MNNTNAADLLAVEVPPRIDDNPVDAAVVMQLRAPPKVEVG